MRNRRFRIASLEAENAALRRAIMGREPDPSVSHGQFLEMARTLHVACDGGRARAEAAEASLSAEREKVERLKSERRMISSHAAMGRITGDGMSVNDICVEITKARNELYQDGKGQGARTAQENMERLRKALEAIRRQDRVTRNMGTEDQFYEDGPCGKIARAALDEAAPSALDKERQT